MKNNNLKGFSSLGLQIIVSTIAISIGVISIVTSTARVEGEPPEKEAVKLEARLEDEEKIDKKANYGQEKAILSNAKKDEKSTEKLIEEVKQQKTVDISKNENNNSNDKGQKTNEKLNTKTIETKTNQNQPTRSKTQGSLTPKTEPKKEAKKPNQEVKEEVKQVVITSKEETKTEEIAFKTIRENDSSLEKGSETIKQKGQNGTKTIVYKVIYSDGKETSRSEISSSISKAPVDQIVRVGTKEKQAEAPKGPNYNVSGKNLPNNHPYTYRADFESRMEKLINDHRAKNGRAPLQVVANLRTSARYKSLSMLQLNYFGHKNPNFSDQSFSYLMKSVFGYTNYSRLGENIGNISSSNLKSNAVDSVFTALTKSKGHNDNMLNSEYKYMAVGIVYSETPGSAFRGKNAIIITQHFAK